MTTSAHNLTPGPKLSARAGNVVVHDDMLEVQLEDGRAIIVPLAWFPRLEAATPEQRQHWRLLPGGVGIHWPDIDEDISVENLLGTDGDLLMDQQDAARGAVAWRGRHRLPMSRAFAERFEKELRSPQQQEPPETDS